MDVGLVRASAGQHQLAHRMCARAVDTGAVDFTHSMGEDDVLKALKFPLNTAIAVPVRTGGAGVDVVLVFLSSRLEQRSPLLLRVLDDCRAALQQHCEWLQLGTCTTGHSAHPAPRWLRGALAPHSVRATQKNRGCLVSGGRSPPVCAHPTLHPFSIWRPRGLPAFGAAGLSVCWGPRWLCWRLAGWREGVLTTAPPACFNFKVTCACGGLPVPACVPRPPPPLGPA